MTMNTTQKKSPRAVLVWLALALCILPLTGALAAETDAVTLAEDTALAHAGLTRDEVTNLYAKQERNGREIEVAFTAGQLVYEYEISASGVITEYSFQNTMAIASAVGKTGEAITADAARDAALAHAGLDAADVTIKKVKIDTDDGITCYEVEFITADAEYEYKVGAYDGTILSCEGEYLVQGRQVGQSTDGNTASGNNNSSSRHHSEDHNRHNRHSGRQ